MKYLNWDEQIISDFGDENICRMYESGYLFTRIQKGCMHQTRSIRISLDKFNLTSENRRILKKTDGLILSNLELPLNDYDYKLGKLAKDFYDTKFGTNIMSVQKVKEMLTDNTKSNFNLLFTFTDSDNTKMGYAICYANQSILHYSYPFYDLNTSPKDMGLGMMIRAIQYAKEKGMKYAYLGSLQRSTDVYKLQFEGLEWFDGKIWQSDLETVKNILTSVKMS